MKSVFLCVLVVLLVASSPAEAQFCTGAPSFRDHPFQVGVTAAFTEGAQGVGGEFAGGGDALFAGAGISVLNFGDLDARSTSVFAFAGADLAVQENQKVFICPAAQISFGVGPDIGPVDLSTFGLQAGGSVGVIASQTGTLMVIPFFGLAAVYDRVTTDFRGTENTESDSSGIASLGVGFVFNRNVGITPSIAIPFSAGSSDPIFSIRLSFNFGR